MRGVEIRVARVADHDERDAGAYGGREGRQIAGA
jgi:hypothetical protein